MTRRMRGRRRRAAVQLRGRGRARCRSVPSRPSTSSSPTMTSSSPPRVTCDRARRFLDANPEADVVGFLLSSLGGGSRRPRADTLFAGHDEPLREWGTLVGGLPVRYKIPQVYLARTRSLMRCAGTRTSAWSSTVTSSAARRGACSWSSTPATTCTTPARRSTRATSATGRTRRATSGTLRASGLRVLPGAGAGCGVRPFTSRRPPTPAGLTVDHDEGPPPSRGAGLVMPSGRASAERRCGSVGPSSASRGARARRRRRPGPSVVPGRSSWWSEPSASRALLSVDRPLSGTA